MAKVTVVIEDKTDGSVNVKMEFDPPLENKPDAVDTKAQRVAAAMLEVLRPTDGGSDEELDDA